MQDHPNELASTLAFNVIVVRFDSAFRVFNEQVSTISPESRDQAKKPNIMAQLIFNNGFKTETEAYNRVVPNFLSNPDFVKKHEELKDLYWMGLITQREFYCQTLDAAINTLDKNQVLTIS